MGQEPGRIVSRRGTVGGGGKAVLKSWKQEKMGKKVYDNVSYFARYKEAAATEEWVGSGS